MPRLVGLAVLATLLGVGVEGEAERTPASPSEAKVRPNSRNKMHLWKRGAQCLNEKEMANPITKPYEEEIQIRDQE